MEQTRQPSQIQENQGELEEIILETTQETSQNPADNQRYFTSQIAGEILTKAEELQILKQKPTIYEELIQKIGINAQVSEKDLYELATDMKIDKKYITNIIDRSYPSREQQVQDIKRFNGKMSDHLLLDKLLHKYKNHLEERTKEFPEFSLKVKKIIDSNCLGEKIGEYIESLEICPTQQKSINHPILHFFKNLRRIINGMQPLKKNGPNLGSISVKTGNTTKTVNVNCNDSKFLRIFGDQIEALKKDFEEQYEVRFYLETSINYFPE